MTQEKWDTFVPGVSANEVSALEWHDNEERNDIAVVGVAARVAESNTSREFWEAICGGADLIRAFPESRIAAANELKLAAAGEALGEFIVPYGYLDDIDTFDPARFAISPSEAELMEPHQRLFLTTAVKAIEDAGYGGDALRGSRTGVYVGAGATQGLYTSGYNPRDAADAGLVMSGKLTSVIAGRLNHFLDLRGPALVIDTACSSSMAALITACRDIREGLVDAAVAGGVRLTLVPPEPSGKGFGIDSSSARTRTFAASSDGTGGGEGVIAMLLKPLRRAVDDGDNIYGVIRGFAMNHDGASAGLTAPNANAQADLLRSAWRDADVDPASISFIEAHGTATELGDPIEISALTDAFATYTDRKQFCGIGSVKTNAGHLDAAAGMAGLLKVLFMLRHRSIPPSLHFSAPNPKIAFDDSPVYVTDRFTEWSGPAPLRAGVSSFGISGTNCHVVLEEAPHPGHRQASLKGHPEIVPLTAQSEEALRVAARDLEAHLREHPGLDLADVSFTLSTGRSEFQYRVCFVAEDTAELGELISVFLAGREDRRVLKGHAEVTVAGGSSEENIDLATHRELSRRAVDLAVAVGAGPATTDSSEALCSLAGLFVVGARVPWTELFQSRRPRRVSLPVYAGSPRHLWRPAGDAPPRTNTAILHPLVHRHVVEGVDLDVFESDLSAGNCFELGEHRINDVNVLVGTGLVEMAYVIASRIFGTRCVLSNLHYRDPLTTRGSEVRRLQCVATRDGESLVLEFRSRLEGQTQWTEHCRVVARPQPKAWKAPDYVDIGGLQREYEAVGESVSYHREMVEVAGKYWGSSQALHYGPAGEALLRFEANPDTAAKKKSYSLFPPILDSGINLGLLREADPFLPLGFQEAAFAEDLPDAGYCWIVPANATAQGSSDVRVYNVNFTDLSGRVVGTLSGYAVSRVRDAGAFLRISDPAAPVHTIRWQPALVPVHEGAQSRPTVLILDTDDVDHPLAAFLADRGADVRIIDANAFDEESGRKWAEQLDHDEVQRIVHIVQAADDDHTDALCTAAIKTNFLLVRELALRSLSRKIEYILVTRFGQSVHDDEWSDPVARAISAAGLCYASEYANILVRTIDVDDVSLPEAMAALIDAPLRRVVAMREGTAYEPVLSPLESNGTGVDLATCSGVVLVTGGLGGMGLAFADYLTARNPNLHVALVNRHFDDRSGGSLPDHAGARLEGLGERRNRVSLWLADAGDPESLAACLQSVRTEAGPLVGIVHTAGVEGNGFAIRKSWEEFERVMRPKVMGARLLDVLTRDDELDFFVLCSSMTAVVGAPGQSDYAAANGYLDGYAARMRSAGRPAVSINWTGWKDSGMAHRNGISGDGYFAEFVSDAEGAALLEHSLSPNRAQVLAGRFIAEEVQRQRATLEMVLDTSLIASAPKRQEAGGGRTVPQSMDNIVVRGLAGRQPSLTERGVAEAWCTTLGTDSVAVTDAFFESGGNSLLASRLQLELDARFPGVMNIADIFVYSTVAQLSEYISSKTSPAVPAAAPRKESSSYTDSALSDLMDQFIEGKISIEGVIEQ